ncbi:MAG: ferritin-like domain-containing protein [Actinomycetota bacterium]|nr:ferritin-like domain-containing protein [Actinomycetota bacterium]
MASGAAANADDSRGPSDSEILNFALNLEYLEAEFYLRAVIGSWLPDNMTTGTGKRGGVEGGRKVSFKTSVIKKFSEEIASDEKSHVAFVRSALGGSAVSRPELSLDASFTAAGLIGAHDQFDVANEVNFLFGAFISKMSASPPGRQGRRRPGQSLLTLPTQPIDNPSWLHETAHTDSIKQ